MGADVVGGVLDCMLTDVGDYGVGADNGDDRTAVGGEKLGVTAEDEFRGLV